MSFYKAQDILNNGATLTIGDTVVVSDTKTFTVTNVSAFISPLDGKATVKFDLVYTDGDKTGKDSVLADHISRWLK